jgi:hypothetical protein
MFVVVEMKFACYRIRDVIEFHANSQRKSSVHKLGKSDETANTLRGTFQVYVCHYSA